MERTPLPRGPLAAVVLVNMTAGFQMNIIFPFVPFMVEELRQTTVDTGFYVGLLAASYFAGQFIASFIWPPLSDKLGRKKLLLLGQLGLTVPFVCFGSATNYWVALAFRFLNGLCQQNWVITNAMLADITDSTNQAQGMAAGAFSWGLANILAPMIGGLLARPTITLPEYFDNDGLFARLPYLLPTVVVFVWGWLAALIGIVFLPADEITWSEALGKLFDRGSGDEYTALSTMDDADGGTGAMSSDEDGRGSQEKETELQSYLRILKERETRLAVSTRVLLPMVWVTYNELLPLWCKSAPESGGLGWNARQIGTIMSIQGIALMFYQPIFFPPLTRWLGVVNSFRFGAVLFTTCIFTLPLIGRLATHPSWLWPIFSFQRTIDMISGCAKLPGATVLLGHDLCGFWLQRNRASCGGGGQLLIINAARVGEQGRVQGLAGGLASMTMAIFPAIGGAIWSYTFASMPYPLHPHLPYGFCGCCSLLMVYVSCILPKTLEKPRKEWATTGKP